MRNLFIFSATLIFAISCSTTSSVELVGSKSSGISHKVINIEVTNKTGEVFDNDIEDMMKVALQNELEPYSGSDEIEEKSLEVLITQYSEGNAFGRWLAPGLGKTILTLEASLKDNSGTVVMQSQVTRSVGAGGGYTIGAWKKVFGDVAEELIKEMSLVK